MKAGEQDKTIRQTEFLFQDPDAKPADRIENLISLLNLEEKMAFMASRQPAVLRLGIKEFHIGGEAAHGLVMRESFSTVFPQTQGLACTWDDALLKKIGTAVSDEARAYYNRRRGIGGLCLWAPTIDMERDPRWGRNEESYGEDPLLTARLSASYMAGMHGDHPRYMKTVPTPKHFYANNNESRRSSCSVNLCPRIKREYYLKVFETAFRLYNYKSLMTSYNAINGTPAMLQKDLAGIVRGEWGFKGFIVSDGGAFTQLADTHKFCADYAESVAASIKAGVDNLSDNSPVVVDAIRRAFERGLLAESHLNEALRRVLSVRLSLGHFDPQRLDPFAMINESIIECSDHRELSLLAAKKSIVLLKNGSAGKPVLPLDEKKTGKVAVLGPLSNIVYRGWYSGRSSYAISPLTALADRIGPENIIHDDGSDIVTLKAQSGIRIGTKAWYDAGLVANRGDGQEGEFFRRTNFGWGNQTFQSLINNSFLEVNKKGLLEVSAEEVYDWFVRTRFDFRAEVPDSGVLHSWEGDAIGINKDGEFALVKKDGQAEPHFAEAPERITIEVRESGLDNAVQAAACADTAVVFVGNNPVLVAKEEYDRPDICLPADQYALLEAVAAVNPRTIAVIISGYPYSLGGLEEKLSAVLYMSHGGPEGGRALTDVLFGGYNPAGRIPMTWYKDQSQLPDLFDYDLAKNPRTYRYVREPVLFPFGHGLSYSRFTYHSLMPVASVIKAGVKQRFKVKINNDSARDAEEVVQFYVSCKRSDYKRAVKELAGFQRISFSPYESRTVEFLLDEELLKVWDPVRRRWFLESSDWEAQMGSSSADIRCTAEFSVEGQKIESRDPSVRNYADSFFDAENYLLKQSGDDELFCSSASDKDCRFFLGPTDFGKRSYSFLELELSGDSEGAIRFSDGQNGAIEYGDMTVKNTADASRIVKVPCEIPQRILEPVLVFTGTVRMSGFRFT